MKTILADAYPEQKERRYEKITPTAYFVAYRRSLTDIPYAKEIWREFENAYPADRLKELETPQMTPQIEARSKLLTKMMNQVPHEQVLELASGLSPLGLIASQDSGVHYIETDLPEILSRKERLVEKLLIQTGEKRDNLEFIPANALTLEDLEKATASFDVHKPIVVIHEGLLRYLSFPEKTEVANNVRALLEKFGGTWITSDITLRRIIQSENRVAEGQRERVAKLTGINLEQNYFDDEAQAKKFFEDLGFEVESHPFLEVEDQLVSPKLLRQTHEQVANIMGPAAVYVMRLKSK